MEQEIIALVNQRIAELFNDVKNTLLAQDSYEQPVDTEHLSHYFIFLEKALQQPYNRLLSLTAFICNQENLLGSLMYPLALLRTELRQSINEKCTQASTLAIGLDVGGIDPDNGGLCGRGFRGKGS